MCTPEETCKLCRDPPEDIWKKILISRRKRRYKVANNNQEFAGALGYSLVIPIDSGEVADNTMMQPGKIHTVLGEVRPLMEGAGEELPTTESIDPVLCRISRQRRKDLRM